MGRVRENDAAGKFLVYKYNNEIVTMKIYKETDGAFFEDNWYNIQKSKAHKVCAHNREASNYAHIVKTRLMNIKEDPEYKRLHKIKTEALLTLNKYKKDLENSIIANTMEDCPEYFI